MAVIMMDHRQERKGNTWDKDHRINFTQTPKVKTEGYLFKDAETIRAILERTKHFLFLLYFT